MEDKPVRSFITEDTYRRIEILKQQMSRRRQCPICKVDSSRATEQEIQHHITRHHILYVCFCGLMDSRLHFLKLHSKKEQHGVQHFFKVDRISWPHLRTLVRNLPTKIPSLPYMKIYDFDKRDPIWGLPKPPQIGRALVHHQEDYLGGGKSLPPTAGQHLGLTAMVELHRPGSSSLALVAGKSPTTSSHPSSEERESQGHLQQEEEDWG